MRGLFVAAAMSLLAACAAAPERQAIYEAHVKQFRAAHPYLEHKIRRADGHQVQAREFNAYAKGRGPTLVLMHGFPDNQHLYDRLIPHLSPHYHVVSFDFLGWGDSEKPTGHLYDVASQRADLEAVIRHFEIAQAVLVVHDLSGQAGIDWAIDHEAQTAGLVLLNTYYSPMASLVAPEAIQFYSTPGLLRDIAVWGATKSGFNFQRGVGGQLARFFSDSEVRDAYLPIITHASVSMRPAFFSSTSVLWQELEARRAKAAGLRQFRKPVHIIFGEDDPYLNPGVAREFMTLFPNARLTLVPKAGHYVQLDQAELVGQQLRKGLTAP
jgi:haloalkane dehalogenase